MWLYEIDISPEHDKPSDDESDDIVLTQFSDDDPSDPCLRKLCDDLVGLTSPGQVAAVLSLYLPQFDWGGTEV